MSNDLELHEKFSAEMKEKFPKLYENLSWGFAVGPGWYRLINLLSLKIDTYASSQKDVSVSAVQVKEKFGALRFYVDGGDDYICGLIDMAEAMSQYTCEKCGAEGELRNIGGYYTTLCEDHYQEQLKKSEEYSYED